MKKRILKFVVSLSRTAVLALVLSALALSTAYPTVTVRRVPASRPVPTATVTNQDQILPGQTAQPEASDKVGTGKKAQSHPAFIAFAPSTVKADSGLDRFSSTRLDQCLPIFSTDKQTTSSESITLPGVSTQVARQFTLVGARPSGTM
jgi:hypothetical protein